MKRSGPLSDVTIVEFPAMGPVPMAGMLFGQLGADVIQLRRPGGAALGADLNNSNKRFVEVDLKQSADVAFVHSLIAGADALIEGFRPGVLERLGFVPADLIAKSPSFVVGRMTGWGQDGPLAQSPGHDLNYLALTGLLDCIGYADRPPVPPLSLLGDMGGGALYLVVGVLSAILHARASGKGQIVDCAMVDGVLSLGSAIFEMRNSGQWHDGREANLVDGGAPFYRVYKCKDGKFLALCPIEPKFFDAASSHLGLDRDVWRRRFDPAAWPALIAELEKVFLERTRDEWCALMEGSDACVTPVLSIEEAQRNAHLLAREAFVATADGKVAAPAPRFSLTPGAIRPAETLDRCAED